MLPIRLITMFFALLIQAGAALAIAGTDTIATPDQPFSARLAVKEYAWPKGAIELVNDSRRHYGWHHWFSELPNDVFVFGYSLDNTRQANALLEMLAAIEAEGVALVLTVAPAGPCPVAKKVTCDAVFALGSPAILNQWFAELPTEVKDGKVFRVFGVHRYETVPPVAPPVLTLHVDGRRVKAGELKLPAKLAVKVTPPSSRLREATPRQIKAADEDPAYLALKKLVEAHEKRREAARQEDEKDED